MQIYLDYNATAPLRPQAAARMAELLAVPANASSMHRYGREAKKHLESARKTIAEAISAWPQELIFTATGTEANVTALRGFPGRRVLVGAAEHSSVLSFAPAGPLPNPPPQAGEGTRISPLPEGGRVREGVLRIPVTSDGITDLAALDAMLAGGEPALVSVMLANNETGVIQPISEIAAICKQHGALLHCDAVQALGKIPVDFGALGVDLLTIAGHKCGGPVGAAALVIRRDLPLAPLLTGGGQELGRRAGTENIPAIAGFAVAVELIDLEHMRRLRGWLEVLETTISSPWKGEDQGGGQGRTSGDRTPTSVLPLPGGGGMVFGKAAPRLPNTTCIAMPGVSNELQLMDFDLKGFAVSAGSACSSGRIGPSHVLEAMGTDKSLASCAIRVSGGWKTTQEEIILFAEAWRAMSARLAKTPKAAQNG